MEAVAVDVDQADFVCGGSNGLHPERRFVNTDLRRLRMIVGLARAHQDRPQATIKEHPNGQKAEQFQ
jgi:hypothetical protein